MPPLRVLLRWAPAVAWMVVIFRLSAIPGSQVPGKYGWVGHLAVYAVLSALTFLAALPYGPRRAASLAVLVSSLYGITDELHQAFVPGRVPDPVDWAVDTVGATVAALLMAAGVKRAARRRPS